jgi:hypothetical protein
MNEPLEEYDDYGDVLVHNKRYRGSMEFPGRGIVSTAKYYVDVFSLNKTKSV